MKTTFSKSIRGGYKAETMTETDANGNAWQISTFKRSNGLVCCSAIQGQDTGKGNFTYEMFGAKRLELAQEKTNGTEAAIKRVHAAGLIEFNRIQAEAPQITAPAYVVGIGQIIFTDSCGNWEEKKRVIYEVKSPGHFKTVTLDGKELRHDDRVRPYSEKFGIGVYYNEGETLPIEEVNNLVNQARHATEERNQAEEQARTAAAIERNQKIAAGIKILPAIPEGVKSVIIGEKFSTGYDPYADYNTHPETTEEIIYLQWSSHTRDIFSEMRKAADTNEKTAHLGTGKGIFETFQTDEDGRYSERGEVFTTEAEAIELVTAKNSESQPKGYKWSYKVEDIEHREKYSMGSGYYLKSGEWKVRKINIGENSLATLQIAAAENRFFCNSQPEATKETPKFEAQEVQAGTVQIVDYSEKAIAVIGDTKPIKDKLKSLGGKFNFRLSCGAGWIFKKSDLERLQKALTPQEEGDTPNRLETEGNLIAAQHRGTLLRHPELEPAHPLNICDPEGGQYKEALKEHENRPSKTPEEAKQRLSEEVKKMEEFLGLNTPDPETIEAKAQKQEAIQADGLSIEELTPCNCFLNADNCICEKPIHEAIKATTRKTINVTPQVAASWSPHGNAEYKKAIEDKDEEKITMIVTRRAIGTSSDGFFRVSGPEPRSSKAGRTNVSLPAPQMFLF